MRENSLPQKQFPRSSKVKATDNTAVNWDMTAITPIDFMGESGESSIISGITLIGPQV
jgi:hypothetical protein